MPDATQDTVRFSLPRRMPPVCGGLPGLGALPSLLKEGLGFFINARERYGDIYTLDLGVTKMLVLNHPRHAQHVLRDHARDYGKGGSAWESVRALIGSGLSASEGAYWLRQRRMMQPHFHRERLAALTHLMVETIEKGLERLAQSARHGEPFDLGHELGRITMEVAVKALFGGDISASEAETVGQAMQYAPKYIIFDAMARSLPSWVPVPGARRFRDAVKEIDEVVFKLIERRRRVEDRGGDLLGMMLDMVDGESGERMTDQQLRDEAVTIFLSGHETMAMTLSFAFGLLMQRPDVQEALHQELDPVLGGGLPTFAHLRHLSLTQMVFHETTRLYPTSYWFPRTALKDDVIDGFHVPARTPIALMSYVVHRHPEFWEDPDQFNPWRFSPEQSEGRHPMALIPFGSGQRMCIGKEFATMEGMLVLSSVLSRYSLVPVEGHPLQTRMTITLQTRDGLKVRLNPRRVQSSLSQVA